MIILTIKVKGESSTYTKKEFLKDNYSVCKENEKLQKLVSDAVSQAAVGDIDEVIVTAKFEWQMVLSSIG